MQNNCSPMNEIAYSYISIYFFLDCRLLCLFCFFFVLYSLYKGDDLSEWSVVWRTKTLLERWTTTRVYTHTHTHIMCKNKVMNVHERGPPYYTDNNMHFFCIPTGPDATRIYLQYFVSIFCSLQYDRMMMCGYMIYIYIHLSDSIQFNSDWLRPTCCGWQ